MSRKICVITGTRAEFGLLRPLIQLISDDTDFHLQLAVTGMHLSPEFGLTYKEIEQAGFEVDEKIEILLSSDSPVGISKSMGLAMIGFAEAFERLKPDMALVLGDRFEIFSAVAAAHVARIPVAHIHGGEVTEGVFDDAFRHAITKMSHLHFTSTEDYRKRIIQLGEHPERVINVGALGVENIRKLDLLPREKLEENLGFPLGKRSMLVTFHPVTLEEDTAAEQFGELLAAIDKLVDFRVIFTKTNADTDGRIINQLIDKYVLENSDRAIVFTSMGQLLYLSALQFVDAVVGNSSSGIIEAPSFKVGTINIGDRQKGRIQATSILNCLPEAKVIRQTISHVLSPAFQESLVTVTNPYEKSGTCSTIVKLLKKTGSLGNTQKTFFDVKFS